MFLKRIRKWIGSQLLAFRASKVKREQKFYNIFTASYAGIVFSLSDKTMDRYGTIASLLDMFREHDVRVFTCCYFDGKTIPLQLIQDKRVNVFSKQDLDIFLFPKDPYNKYVKREFDLLVDASLADHLPMDYLLRLSKAKCKVGNLSCGKEKYDILIDTSKNDDNFVFYIEQVKHFLSTIK